MTKQQIRLRQELEATEKFNTEFSEIVSKTLEVVEPLTATTEPSLEDSKTLRAHKNQVSKKYNKAVERFIETLKSIIATEEDTTGKEGEI